MYEPKLVEPIALDDIPLRRPRIAQASSRLLRLARTDATGIDIAIHDDLAETEQDWRAFEKTATCTVFQTFAWLSKWQRHVGTRRGSRPVIVTGRGEDGKLAFLLPLSIETSGLVRRLTWLGRELCDYNAPLLSESFMRETDRDAFVALWQSIVARLREAGMRYDLVDLDKMPETVGGQANPFAYLNVLVHPSGAHIATLGADWDSFYAEKRSSATRKKERKRLCQLSAHGETRFVDATALDTRAELANTLIAQKMRWFARMGVNNIFAPPGTSEFFMDVATDPAMQDIVHLSSLNVGETVAATNMGLRFNGSYCLVLSTYADGELARFGPGRAHLHELMRYAIKKGDRWFDFTVGDEAYKLDWSDKIVTLYDYLEPATIRGSIVAWSVLGFRTVKCFIKHTPVLWRAYTMLRLAKAKLNGAKESAPETE